MVLTRRPGAALLVLTSGLLLGLVSTGQVPHRPAEAVDGVVTARTVNGSHFRAHPGAVTAPPRLRLRAWAVADLDTGALLVVHRQHRHLPQASTIKLLTAVTAVDRVPEQPDHRVTWREAHPSSCTCAGLRVGARYSRASLLVGMLLPSGNDAAEALAGSDPEGRAAFVRAMNTTARELGASDTRVVTPSGLTAAGAHSSARDLLIFLRAAQAEPVVEQVLRKRIGRVGPIGTRGHVVKRRTDYVNRYPAAQGKSGFTTPARNTLVVATPMRLADGTVHRIGVALLGAEDGRTTPSARALTRWAARNHARLSPLGYLPPVPLSGD